MLNIGGILQKKKNLVLRNLCHIQLIYISDHIHLILNTEFDL
jgi:hypothetical protein